MEIQVTPSSLVEILDTVLIPAKRPGFIWGKPGVGKSAIMAQLAAKRAGWKFLDFRLLIRDSVDVRGVPFVDEKTGRTMWAVPAEFPKDGEGIWFLDELNAAHPQVQAVAYQLVQDRAIGEYKLPDGWVVMAAGNNDEDGAVTHRMASPLRSRFVHLNLEVSLPDWLRWASSHDIHPMVIGFLNFRPELIHQFAKTEKAFPCPRTWEFVSDIMKMSPSEKIELPLIAGTVGQGAAIEFLAFARLYRGLPDIGAILQNPKTAPIPASTDMQVYYAIAAALGRRATVANFGAVVTYLDRLPLVEFNVMAVRDAISRLPELMSTKVFTQWCHTHQDVNLGA